MKIIFLDIDGVLNTETDFFELKKYGHDFNQVKGSQVLQTGKLAILESLVRNTEANIVLSSTWREFYTLDEIHTMFTVRGWSLPRETFFGTTPIHRRGRSDEPMRHRGNEIAEWLENHEDQMNAFDFVILDDNCDSLRTRGFVEIGCEGVSMVNEDPAETDRRWSGDYVETNMETGLTIRQAAQAAFVLGRTEEILEESREYQAALRLFF